MDIHVQVKSGDALAVDISTPDGALIYHGLAKMDSGTEVYEPKSASQSASRRTPLLLTEEKPPVRFGLEEIAVA